MDAILADQAVSISEFKKNPSAVLRGAKQRPVAVLSHNKPAFYMLQPAMFEAMLEALADQDLVATVRSRLHEMPMAIDVDIDTV